MDDGQPLPDNTIQLATCWFKQCRFIPVHEIHTDVSDHGSETRPQLVYRVLCECHLLDSRQFTVTGPNLFIWSPQILKVVKFVPI